LNSIPEFLIPPNSCKALIFDLDGTLADTMPLHLLSWRMVGEKYGFPITDQMINDRAGTPTLQVAKDLNEDFNWTLDPEAVYIDKNAIYEELLQSNRPIQPIPSVYQLAASLRNKIPMAIGTGSTRTDAILALEDMGVSDWFPIMVTADDVENGKPHPETYLRCAEGLQIDPKLCVVYEDGPKGIEAALNAGMSAVNIITEERNILK